MKMGAVNQKYKWILDGCEDSVLRLWNRYQHLTVGKNSEVAPSSSFSAERLVSLGVDQAFSRRLSNNERLAVLQSQRILEQIEQFMKDEQGKSLQKIIAYDINSRVLTDIELRFSDAGQLVEDALAVLGDRNPWISNLLSKMMCWIIPIYHEKNGRPFRRGFSHIDYLGVLFTTFIERRNQAPALRKLILAVDIAHELGHQVLMLYQLSDKIILSPLDAPVYSSVRKATRPAILSLHACIAAAYMMEVCASTLAAPMASALEREFAKNSIYELSYHQEVGLNSLEKACQFSIIGNRIMMELKNQMASMKRLVTHGVVPTGELSYFGLLA